MELQIGNWVRTGDNREGKVSLICKKNAYIHIESDDIGAHITSFLLTELTKIEGPTKPGE